MTESDATERFTRIAWLALIVGSALLVEVWRREKKDEATERAVLNQLRKRCSLKQGWTVRGVLRRFKAGLLKRVRAGR